MCLVLLEMIIVVRGKGEGVVSFFFLIIVIVQASLGARLIFALLA